MRDERKRVKSLKPKRKKKEKNSHESLGALDTDEGLRQFFLRLLQAMRSTDCTSSFKTQRSAVIDAFRSSHCSGEQLFSQRCAVVPFSCCVF